MLELRDYQKRTVEALDVWLNLLDVKRAKSEQMAEAVRAGGHEPPRSLLNYPRDAWDSLEDAGGLLAEPQDHVDRSDGANRPIPHACLKVPTGGGKTLLGVAALERTRMQTGLVVWIVPSRAIYAQTIGAFRSRDHPYREHLEAAGAGRVKLFEKDDSVSLDDLSTHLCVMLLMYPAANRHRGREFLRMFRNSGRYPTLLPRSDDLASMESVKQDNPDLDLEADGSIKHSLFNLLKIRRPVVVLDEAHKAYGNKAASEFVQAVNRLNPRLVVELSATPNPHISNLLVDISGVDLKKEQMIKLPVEVTSVSGDWRDTLSRAHDTLEDLTAVAKMLESQEGRYIRPIAVVRVERTGKDQRGADRIHAEDAREHLIHKMGESPRAVRVKSSEDDEIAGEDLMSPLSSVRWIITKAALMEGWDCPFAYVLVMLDNTSSAKAVTQLMGRVMRQPHARATRIEDLDKSYVFCWQTDVDEAVSQVKRGLENEGMTGLTHDVRGSDAVDFERVAIRRRKRFRGEPIFLPKVLHADDRPNGGSAVGWRELDYQRHVLEALDWERVSAPSDPVSSTDASVLEQTTSVDLGADSETEAERADSERADGRVQVDPTVEASALLLWMTRQISDLVPNSWRAARVVGDFAASLEAQGLDESTVFAQRRHLITQLRQHLAEQIEQQAEQVFTDKLRAGDIRFDLEASEPNYMMQQEFTLPVATDDHTLERGFKPVQKSLFEPVFENQFDTALEKDFAFYVDQHEAIQWWHRVAVRQQRDYYLRGWNQDRIWPDFVAMSSNSDGKPRLLVVETKGEHLAGNADTDYKTKVFATLEAALNGDGAYDCGEVSLDNGRTKGRFRIVFREDQFPAAMM
ncbi:MAG: DEAD/DEAH box helicase family protein [Acidimicrobiaceae bacterium]|nr:DEAD/DEAH box helicase family protein [Acidimicrobiaceae bacterium]